MGAGDNELPDVAPTPTKGDPTERLKPQEPDKDAAEYKPITEDNGKKRWGTKRPPQNPDLPPTADNSPADEPEDPLPPREPLMKVTPDPPKVKVNKTLELPKSNLPESYFDSNGHARPYSDLDPENITDTMNNDQFHYRN
jgi:hypothetical protein